MKNIDIETWNHFQDNIIIPCKAYVIAGFKKQKINVHYADESILTYGSDHGSLIGIRDDAGFVRYHFQDREEIDKLLERAKERNDPYGDQFVIG